MVKGASRWVSQQVERLVSALQVAAVYQVCWSRHPCRRPGLLLCSILFLKQRVCLALSI